MRMSTAIGERKGSRLVPILYLPKGRSGGGFLIIPLGSGQPLTAPLKPARVKLLLALHQAKKEDAELKDPYLDREAKGLRSPEALGNGVGEVLKNSLPIGPEAVVRSVCKLRAEVESARKEREKAEGAPIQVPEVIKTHRGMGYRLAFDDLKIIDRTVS